jgi:acetyl/propionyl-CoA carboxylase alpha subunit
MSLSRLLIANRGEIAIRIARAAADLGIPSVAVYSDEDERSLHTRAADETVRLEGTGAAAYLDAEQFVRVARAASCDAIHPGYGFLSENAAFARLSAEAGLTFVGPSAEMLDLLGDKTQARALAERCRVPVLPGTGGPTSPEQAREFMASLGEGAEVMVKALAGGGGRGLRLVSNPDDLERTMKRCQSEAQASFGNGDLYVEQFVPRARHIEVQVLGDGYAVSHLWERECSIQRRNQKVIEIAPAFALDPEVRQNVLHAAGRMAEELRYQNAGTFEFLVDADGSRRFYFIEANPRLQVEHTVTEEVTGIDVVQAQLRIAGGARLSDLGLTQAEIPSPRGYAIQGRINMETMGADGLARPSGGTLTAFEPPSGPGLRVDTFGYAGYTTSPAFDSLLAKLIAHSPSQDFGQAAARAARGLSEFRIEGVSTNSGFLQSILRHSDFVAGKVYTRFVEEHSAELAAGDGHPRRYFEGASVPAASASQPAAREAPKTLAGAKIDTSDPLAVLHHGKAEAEAAAADSWEDAGVEEGLAAVRAPLQGTIISVDVGQGDLVRPGQQVLVMEAMKMQHALEAPAGGIVQRVEVAPGDAVVEGAVLLLIEEAEVEGGVSAVEEAADLDQIRPDLEEVRTRHAYTLDENRPEAVARRRKTGQRTARENVEQLCDPGSFSEYGALAIAAQRRRRSVQDLIERTPADGMVTGVGHINGHLFDESRSRAAVLCYDYTVLAGTQGTQNHRKKDRLLELAEEWRLPVVIFTEGGGGRPGDTDGIGVAGLEVMTFHQLGRLSGLVPLIAINSGRCFAGNAALLGMCDVVIATRNSNIGMGGPAMIEGGGLGIFRPEEVGPMSVQVPNGVVDIAVEDEVEAVEAARRYLSYFQGSVAEWECADQRLLRRAIPENRLRVYDLRALIETLADKGSVLELRRYFGLGMVTAFARIEGRPIGIVANNPHHLAGAVDSDGADKASRFIQLCDAFDIPILSLVDTPGIMVGPEVEKTALVRHSCRLFVTTSSITTPFMSIVLRKAYGLGAQAMLGGSTKVPFFTVSWPTGEFGGMGLEGAVKLGYRNELAAIEDPEKRRQLYEEMVARMYENGKAVSVASHFEVDEVIDPAESRTWITSALKAIPPPEPRAGKKRPFVDTW